MKKNILILILTFIAINPFWSQCVYTCSNYAVSQISYSAFPTGGNNVIPQLSPTVDDGITPPVSIGFNFDFYCTTYNQVLICSNGFLQFNIGSPPNLSLGSNPAQSFPNLASPNALIALNMNDFDPSAGGSITYTTIGVSPNQRFIVTYSNVPIWYDAFNNIPSSPVYNSGQIVLHETTNIIEIHSAAIGLSPYLGTQGLEDAIGSFGSAAPGRNNAFWSTTSTAYRWSPYSITPPSAITGNTSVCEGSVNMYQTTLNASALSYNWIVPANWTIGTSTTSAISPTAGYSGNVQVNATYSCGTSAFTTLYVNVNPTPSVSITSTNPYVLCSGQTSTISGSGAATYTLLPTGQNGVTSFTVSPLTTTAYTLVGTSPSGCISEAIASTSVFVNQTPTITINSGAICIGKSFTLIPSGASIYTLSSIFSIVTPTVSGISSYSAIGSSSSGCVSNVAISNLTVFALPTLTASTTKSVICINETTSISASGASTYTWNTSFVGSIITLSPTSTTAYTVTGTDMNGCVNTSTYTIKVSVCLGINSLMGENGLIKIYPNPNSGTFNISINSVGENTSAIEIFNSLGQLVLSQKTDANSVEVDLRHQANGLYYLKIKNADQEIIKKIVKE